MTQALAYSSNGLLRLVLAPLPNGPSRLIGHLAVDPKQRKPYLVVQLDSSLPSFPLSSTQLIPPSPTTNFRIRHTQTNLYLISKLHSKPQVELPSPPIQQALSAADYETKDDQTVSPSEQYPEQTKNDPEKATPGTSPKLKRAARVIDGISHPPPAAT